MFRSKKSTIAASSPAAASNHVLETCCSRNPPADDPSNPLIVVTFFYFYQFNILPSKEKATKQHVSDYQYVCMTLTNSKLYWEFDDPKFASKYWLLKNLSTCNKDNSSRYSLSPDTSQCFINQRFSFINYF